MKTLLPKLLLLFAVLVSNMYPVNIRAARLTLEQKQEKPKMMKGKYWNLLQYADGDIIAYEHTSSDFTLVRFDKGFNVKQEFTVKKAPRRLAYINADGPQIDAVLYDENNSVRHLVFDKTSLNLLRDETLLEQQKYGKYGVKYTDVFVLVSPNGKYIALLAMWDHARVGIGFNSNHLYLYNDKFEKIGNWSLDEDLRGVSLGSKESAALWQQYYPCLKVLDDGTVVYAALSDYGSNLYSSEFGSGTSLKVHVLSKEGDKTCDFGRVAEKLHLQSPRILSYDGSKLLLTADVYNYPPAKVKNVAEFVYRIQGYCILSCDLVNNTFVSDAGTYDASYASVVESVAWNRTFVNTGSSVLGGMTSVNDFGDLGSLFTESANNHGLVVMDSNGRNRKVFTFGYAYTQKNKGLLASAESHLHDLLMDKVVYAESNSTLCTEVVGNKYYWVVERNVQDNSWSKERYETTVSVRELDMTNREVTTTDVFQQKSKEAMHVQCVPVSEGKYLLLIDNCQWGTLEL